MPKTNLNLPDYYINRELSWLEFNHRVLEEAIDHTQPLLERLRFLCIVSNNLDEFFEVRVAGVKQQIENDTDAEPLDGMTPREAFGHIRNRVCEMVKDQYYLWHKDLVPKLAKEGIRFNDLLSLKADSKRWAKKYFMEHVFPVLTPLAVDSSHPFPQLGNKSHNIIVRLRRSKKSNDVSFAIVQIPRILTRLITLPGSSMATGWDYIFLSQLVKLHVGILFPGAELVDANAFRITRNSDLYIDEDEADNLLETIEEELRKRNKGNAVRLEVEEECPAEIEQFLMDTFRLGTEDVYRHSYPLSFTHLMFLCNHEAYPHLRDRPWSPVTPLAIQHEPDIFALMRRQEIMLHHPYESFNPVIDFVTRASTDPQVLAIKMTLYRTSGDSPIVRALIEAAENGKQVTALVELKARFDEANNITWARRMEEAGVHVVYGVVGLKVHCKMLQITRRDEDRIRHYVHLGTGNYHPSTARIYTDLGILTTKIETTREVSNLFNILTGMSRYHGIRKLMVAPFDMPQRFQRLIQRERDNAKAGKPAKIIAKMNALVDDNIIRELFEASRAGVKIDLIIRGVCCLRPGIPGISENIRVISIVGRFLEHSRIYYFENGGTPEVYVGSADWMSRNLYRRVEVIFPIENPKHRERIITEILPTLLQDCIKARELQPNGRYRRLKPQKGKPSSQAQFAFRQMARKMVMETTVSSSDYKIKPIHSTNSKSKIPATKK